MIRWRKIIAYDEYTGHCGCNRGASSTFVILDCGHDKHYKTSALPKGNRVRCKKCESKVDENQ